MEKKRRDEQAKEEFVEMVRPEDKSADPVIAKVKPADVQEWKSQGWVVKQ